MVINSSESSLILQTIYFFSQALWHCFFAWKMGRNAKNFYHRGTENTEEDEDLTQRRKDTKAQSGIFLRGYMPFFLFLLIQSLSLFGEKL